MSNIQKIREQYSVKIVNSYEELYTPNVVEFVCNDKEHVKTLIEVYCGHYSGDPIEVFINGEKAVLHLDWGLADVNTKT